MDRTFSFFEELELEVSGVVLIISLHGSSLVICGINKYLVFTAKM